MIKRYSHKEFEQIFSDENRFNNYLIIEEAVVEAYFKLGLIPEKDYEAIVKKAHVDLASIEEIEAITKHDVIAFTRSISLQLGEEKKWFHYSLTSTDVVDSAQSLTLKAANSLLLEDLDNLIDVTRKMAKKYEKQPIMGRTHGMHAEITSFGLKWALWFDELNRCKERFLNERKNIEVIKLSGAVGNYANIPMAVEEYVAKKLGMEYAKISTQVLSRDRHAGYIFSLAQIASCLEKMATEIRHLSRSEIGEVQEPFSKGQKGSSAMPHKKNPIGCENICGCARLMRSYVDVALEDNNLWHERDISHSSAERIILPDACTLLDYMLKRFTGICKDLVVNTEKMNENILLHYGVTYSGGVLSKLINKGMSREEAYDLIQPIAFKALNEKKLFRHLLIEDEKVSKVLTKKEITECFDENNYLKNVSNIYNRLLKPGKSLLVLGSQWGDEGKGKITNFLSEKADIVIRYQGGNNAGHTIVLDGHKYALRLVPSGVFNEKVKCILANGMVINPRAFKEEVEEIRKAGFPANNIYISDRAHVLFDHHIELDRLNEESLGSKKIGTTKRGIGPAYTDKISRVGMRMCDFISDEFPELYKNLLTIKNKQIIDMGGNPIDYDKTVKEYLELANFVRPMVTDTVSMIGEARKERKNILFEGAQGALLDVDFGSYPYVTSSNVTSGGTVDGTGIGCHGIDDILGIVKAYETRVGEGAFPTEQLNEIGDLIRERGHEYGTVTHRPRRTGFLDLPALKYSIQINSISYICLTLVDVLTGFDKVPVCTHYEYKGQIIDTLPSSDRVLRECRPVYEYLDGWDEDISDIKSYDKLPENVRKYVEFIEKETGTPVVMVSTGPNKNQTIIREEIF
jgi:adenylosuccinate lyase